MYGFKQIPLGIQRRLSDISANKEIFDNAKEVYQEALEKAGHSHKLSYEERVQKPKSKCKPRIRKITWYNPPLQYCPKRKHRCGV